MGQCFTAKNMSSSRSEGNSQGLDGVQGTGTFSGTKRFSKLSSK